MLNIVEEIFRRQPADRPAIVCGSDQWTFGKLEGAVLAAVEALGDIKGRRVGLYCPNGISHIVWSLAVLKGGGVLIPVAPELSPVEREEVARTTAFDGLICADGRHWHEVPPKSRALEVDGLPEALWCAGWSYEADFPEDALAALNPALVRFSSGTTGRRKGVVLSHDSLLARVQAANDGLKIGPGDRVIWILPMAHHFAVSIILYLIHGATTVVELSHLGPDVFRALKEHIGTVLYASPFHYAMLSAFEDAAPVESLRLAVSTAAPLPVAVAELFLARFGVPVRQALGIIECGLPVQNDLWPVEKPGSVGRPHGGFEVELREKDGETGELFFRGPGMVDAYLAPWMPRDRILHEGWFRTGDLAKIDADGAVTLEGRSHSVINVGGMKCFPEEVEAVLSTHPDVVESRVRGMSHPTFGNVPVAEIVVRNPSQPPKISALVATCRSRLSSYKLPVKFTFVEALPKTPSGKIQR